MKPPVDAPTSIAGVPARIDAKVVEGGEQASRLRDWRIRTHRRSARSCSRASTLWSALSAGCELTRTRPAMIRRWAPSRLGARPRRAISSVKPPPRRHRRRTLPAQAGCFRRTFLEGFFCTVVLCAVGMAAAADGSKGVVASSPPALRVSSSTLRSTSSSFWLSAGPGHAALEGCNRIFQRELARIDLATIASRSLNSSSNFLRVVAIASASNVSTRSLSGLARDGAGAQAAVAEPQVEFVADLDCGGVDHGARRRADLSPRRTRARAL